MTQRTGTRRKVMSEREELIQNIAKIAYNVTLNQASQISDFILKDRLLIVAPLIGLEGGGDDLDRARAIDKTLANAGYRK